MAGDGTDTFHITFEFPDGSEHTVTTDRDEYVLAAARRAGLDLPSRCEVGWDLTCAVRVLDGELDHTDAQRYFPADQQAGFALICRATPRADLRLRTHQAIAMRDHRLAHRLPTPYGV
ncbi:2Fe-2S iron-sulfur cluster-binding protein [Pseudonocardia asaccharolytica]|uniref:Ferredoxin n=1 Tax=Pseudonocardia asaccharolytica DSM 44247 = NBRC 16224 TaxID=1123024 RepID=A0A511D6M4_9PSEU|nr:2Fe-2S iron-sulfur cluster-binding protein [Pseudonocardia asaccharolytica]GEL20435.1 ferredoxin [Pseudonocardia asaccharolytica DSM 44247 = NBRC 16224]